MVFDHYTRHLPLSFDFKKTIRGHMETLGVVYIGILFPTTFYIVSQTSKSMVDEECIFSCFHIFIFLHSVSAEM